MIERRPYGGEPCCRVTIVLSGRGTTITFDTNRTNMADDTNRVDAESIFNQFSQFPSRRDVLKKGAAATAATGLGLSTGAGSAGAHQEVTALTPKKKFEQYQDQTFILLENPEGGKIPHERPVKCGGSKQQYHVYQIFFLGIDAEKEARESYLLVPTGTDVETAELYTFAGDPKPCEGDEKGKFEFVRVDYQPVDMAQQMAAEAGQDKVNPVAVLNYALVLERLEATFYTRGLEEFSEACVENSDVAAKFGDEVQNGVYQRLTEIRDHEQSHVDYLVKTINQLGGDPVSEDQVAFAFQFDCPSEFIKTAQTFETVGVSAYDGAINLLQEDKLLTAAATVATVEGRHSAYLNNLVGKSPFPRAFDNAKPPEEILKLVDPFVESDVKALLELV